MKPFTLTLLRTLGHFWAGLQGAELHPNALVHGFPRITHKGNGRIRIGLGATLNVARWSNPLNDSRGMRLHAGPDAEIIFADHAGASTSRIIAFSSIHIGEHSLIGAGSLICDSDMHEVPLGSSAPVKTAPIRIGKHVFIGANCTILKGVTIGDGAVIGAASVVTRNIPPGVLAAGNPASIIRKLLSSGE